ncbi:MAG: glycosyltransferase [Litorilinea sp.]
MTHRALKVGHIKDEFLPRSETFIYNQLLGVPDVPPVILDRYAQQNATLFPVQSHFSPVTALGAWAGWAERGLLRYFQRSPYLETAIRRQKITLLHAHFGQLGALFAPIAQRHQVPLLTSFYGKDLSVFARDPKWAARFDLLWQIGRRFLVLGPTMQKWLVELGCPSPKITILPLPIDVDLFEYREHTPPPPTEPALLLTVGRLLPKKGIDLLLRALAQVPAGPVPPPHLNIVGDGPQRARLEHLAHELGLSDRVHFLGWLAPAQVAAQMAAAHVFVLASRSDPTTGETEGSPTVLLEAQASGLPVLSTRHADIPSVVHAGASGLLVAENDVAALANAVAEIVHSPERWAAMGRAGRAYVTATHDIPVVGRQLKQIYISCLHAHTSQPGTPS